MNDLFYQLALKFLHNVGPVNAKYLVSYCGGVEAIFGASRSDLLAIPGIGNRVVDQIVGHKSYGRAEEELNLIEKHEIATTFYLEQDYPRRLSRYKDAPLLLYYQGALPEESKRHVVVIGTRSATAYGKRYCQSIIEDLKGYQCVIISGLAYGIDAEAHRSALNTDQKTYAVMGNGLPKVYPPPNRQLADKILKSGGGLISEFAINSKAERENFPMRNRIVAAFSDVVLVIESARKGGSMITAELANGYDKDVFAVPGRITDEKSVGCNHLIKSHKAFLCTSAEDIAYIMRWEQNEATVQMSLPLDLSENQQRILAILGANPEARLDSLHYETGLSLTELSTILLELEFKGMVRSLPGKKYMRC